MPLECLGFIYKGLCKGENDFKPFNVNFLNSINRFFSILPQFIFSDSIEKISVESTLSPLFMLLVLVHCLRCILQQLVEDMIFCKLVRNTEFSNVAEICQESS